MKTRSIETSVVVRALAILLVVANHAYPERLHGGMNVLLVLSGLSMAQVAFTDKTSDTLKAFYRFGIRLVIPSLLVFFASAAMAGRLPVAEMLLYSNWLTPERVSLFPIWYTQAVVQMLIVLALLFAALNLTPRIRTNPALWTGLLFAASMMICMLYLHDRSPGTRLTGLPQLVAWHFMFGWMFWGFSQNSMTVFARRMWLTAIHILASVIIFILLEGHRGTERFFFMMLPIMLLIWLDRLRLPVFVAQILSLISQATFAIFLLHYSFFALALELMQRVFSYEIETIPAPVRLFAGVLGPLLLWVLWQATARVWRRYDMRNSPPAQPRAAGSV